MMDRILEELSRGTPGFVGAAIMGTDGLPLAHRSAEPGPDLELFSAECSALLKSLGSMTSQRHCGDLRGLATAGERWSLLLERVTEHYFLLLVVSPETPVGQCRYQLRRAALALEGDLA
jgi:predicted regulator of Ras-like GTPase activity (Roadblock/LC7/MglB family)